MDYWPSFKVFSRHNYLQQEVVFSSRLVMAREVPFLRFCSIVVRFRLPITSECVKLFVCQSILRICCDPLRVILFCSYASLNHIFWIFFLLFHEYFIIFISWRFSHDLLCTSRFPESGTNVKGQPGESAKDRHQNRQLLNPTKSSRVQKIKHMSGSRNAKVGLK